MTASPPDGSPPPASTSAPTPQRRLHEAEARAAILEQKLKVTRTWLVDAQKRTERQVADLRALLERTEEESRKRLELLRAEQERHRQHTQMLVEKLARTELDSQQRLALLRAARSRKTDTAAADGEEAQGAVLSTLGGRSADGEPVALATQRVAPPPVSNVVTVIRPAESRRGIDLRELWQYRYLFAALIRRNIRVEFDSTRLGSLWSVARPVMLAIVFVMFRNFSNAETREGLPYAVWVYTGLLFWTYFTDAATNAAVAVRNDAPLLTKVYYPRLLTPMVPILSGLVTLGVGIIPILGMMVWFGMTPGWMIVLLPLVVIQCIALALGLGLIVSSISIENRDWERIFIFSLTVAFWISPVIYAPEMIPPQLRWLYYLNPMAGIMVAFRATMFSALPAPVLEWAYSGGVSLLLLIVGVWAFRRTEIRLLDRL